MSAPASEDLRELERLLFTAAERDETMTLAAVQSEFSCGHADATGMLDSLREHGKAVEVAPGEWRGPTQDEIDSVPPAPLQVSVPGEPVEPDAMRELDARARLQGETVRAGGVRVAQVMGEPTVRLTMPIAMALDAEAIGKIVKAAIEGLEDGEVFVLEVTP